MGKQLVNYHTHISHAITDTASCKHYGTIHSHRLISFPLLYAPLSLHPYSNSITNRQSFIVMTWHVLLASPPFSTVRSSTGELLPRALLLFSLCPFLQLHTHTAPFIEILNPNLLCAYSFLTKASPYSPFSSSCSIADEHYGLKGSVIIGFVCASGDGCGHSPCQEPLFREGSRLL